MENIEALRFVLNKMIEEDGVDYTVTAVTNAFISTILYVAELEHGGLEDIFIDGGLYRDVTIHGTKAADGESLQ